jgi:polygalacturonase
MDTQRRDFMKFAGGGLALSALPALARSAHAASAATPAQTDPARVFDIRAFGAVGDGVTIDSPAINRAIAAAARAGGGMVVFPPGTYASYSVHLQSRVSLYLEQGAVLLAAPTPLQGTTHGGYDAAEPQGPWGQYQDFGHNHWHNSLIWGVGLHDVAILGPGLIHGKGLSDGHLVSKSHLPNTFAPGVGNKSIALKDCHNVLLRDFSILQGGWFGILATGVDNLVIDHLTVDTNRDGMDIDCCRNVRIVNTTINSPNDDGMCLKSSYALGYLKPTQDVTISDCLVCGYVMGSVLDGTWKHMPSGYGTGRIKCGSESNGGFIGITISNCVFERCWGLALETVDGGPLQDITVNNLSMRDIYAAPLFMRLGARLRGPAGTRPGVLRRVMISNIACSGSGILPSAIAGIPGHDVADVQINDVYLEQFGGADAAMAARVPPEHIAEYPEPTMFGALPACGMFIRHARNIQLGNVEVVVQKPDARPAFWLMDVDQADFFRLRVPRTAPAFALHQVREFRSFGSAMIADVRYASTGAATVQPLRAGT